MTDALKISFLSEFFGDDHSSMVKHLLCTKKVPVSTPGIFSQKDQVVVDVKDNLKPLRIAATQNSQC